MKNRGLAEEFASGTTKGMSSNMFIEGDTIYSYGWHFPIAKRIGNEYLLNTKRYSRTTTAHQYHIECAIEGKTIWDAPGCDINKIPQYFLDRIQDIHNKILKARSRTGYYVLYLESLTEKWKRYKNRFNLKSENVELELLLKNKEQIKSKIFACKLDMRR